MKVVVCSLFLLVAFSGPAAAQTGTVSFSKPVQLPAVLLGAGTYSLRAAGHYLVLVVDKNGLAVATLHVAPTTRAIGGEGKIVTLREAIGGQPPHVAAWYPTDGTDGLEVLYPRNQ